jgi:glutamyl-tRNA synthetase
MEDLDGPRVKPEAARQAIDDLQWLGLDWDEGPIYQSPRMGLYNSAIDALLARGHAYPCVCSRREVESAASAPHAEDGAAVYPGTCRGRFRSVAEARDAAGRAPALRFAVPQGPDGVVQFHDAFRGDYRVDVANTLGDFVIAKGVPPEARGHGSPWAPAYQLAVVVDDSEMGVTDVVRGDDLIDSTPRQMLVYRALGLADRTPRYYHLPLVVGTDGRRLAKRHGDTRLSHYRERGVSPGRVLSLLGRWCGVQLPPAGGAAEVLKSMLKSFSLETMPREAITLTPADDAWLRALTP